MVAITDPIIPGISDERAQRIAQTLQRRDRIFYYDVEDVWLVLLQRKLINKNGYSTAAGRALYERIKNHD